MAEHVFAAVCVVASWWMSTGVVMLLCARAARMRGVVRLAFLAVGAAVGLCAVGGVVWSSTHATGRSAYLGFFSALAVWGWHELAFLTGAVTGPRTGPCPSHLRGLSRFRAATATVIHHELALFGTGLVLLALTWGAPNQAGPATFGVLWLMRLSTKLNLFVGVPHANTELMPADLRYLSTYFGPPRLSWWLPASLASVLAVAALLVSAVEQTPMVTTLVGTLFGLGVIEHLFLARPFGDAALWRWATSGSAATAQAPARAVDSGRGR